MTDYPAIDSEEFTLDGIRFRWETFRDYDMYEPWKEHDGHGVISDWTARDKSSGERVLALDRNSEMYYDFAATVKIARKRLGLNWRKRKLMPAPNRPCSNQTITTLLMCACCIMR